jgi:hypothetical protein
MLMLRKCTQLIAPVAALAFILSAVRCTDSGLEPARSGPSQLLDDELRLSGEICLTPASDAQFPVKILFVVDTSDSMSVTDRSNLRTPAIRQVMERYSAQPAVQFGIIAFDSRIDRVTKGFTGTSDLSRLSTADRLTDYQGALGAAYQMISEDIVASSFAERARSKYVVVFFSDGTPDPQCSSRVTPCGAGECPVHQHCRAGVCKPDYLICTVARKDWEEAFDPPIPTEMYPELGQGADYNQPSQILRAVDDIISLQDFYHVGEIRLHTAFLYDPEAATDPLAIPFGLDREGGVELMTAMAEHGFGTFTEFDKASKIDFLSINYTSFKEENGLAMVLADNINVIDTGAGLQADTDGDGLTDEAEAGKTCKASSPVCTDPQDSDGDGYTDLFEERNRVSGFDPLDPKQPLTPCSSKGKDLQDSDGDLLRDCEEEFLKTDPDSPDSDGDRIPDGMEFRLGMDPLDREDAFADPDRDGERNFDEAKAHTNPQVAVSPTHPPVRYLYEVVPFTKPEHSEAPAWTGEQCFKLDVRHIKLVTTGKGTAQLGFNRVLLTYTEVPVGRANDLGQVRVACVDARYLDGAVKSPWDGRVVVKQMPDETNLLPKNQWGKSAYFIPAKKFDQRKHCADRTTDVSPPDAGVDTNGGGL